VGLAREFPLPNRRILGHWEVDHRRQSSIGKLQRLEVSTRGVSLASQEDLRLFEGPLDRVEARGAGFSEMHSYFQLPFHDTAVASDACVTKDRHARQLYDTVHVCSSNPAWLYTFNPAEEEFKRLSLNHLLPRKRWQSVIPRLRTFAFGSEHARFPNIVAVHDEVRIIHFSSNNTYMYSRAFQSGSLGIARNKASAHLGICLLI